jgi:integrase
MTRPGRPFRAQPRHPVSGKQIKISARTARELEVMLHQIDTLRAELRIGLRSPEYVARVLRRLVHGPITLERAAVAYARREGLAPETSRRVLRSWLSGAASSIAARELDTLDAGGVQQWLDKLQGQGLASSTLGASWRTLRAVARYAIERGWIGAAPWGQWRPMIRGARRRRERESARSPTELMALLLAAHELDEEAVREDPRALGDFEARLAAVAMLGLRQGEVAGLRWRDRDASRRSSRGEQVFAVTIARQWNHRRLPKGRAVATLLVHGELFDLFDGLRARHVELGILPSRADADGPIFPDRRALAQEGSTRHHASGTRPWPIDAELLREAVRRAGLPKPASWTATSLRDTFVTLEATSYGDDLPAFQARTRHATVQGLLHYLRARIRAPAPPGYALPPKESVRLLR